MTKDLVPDYCFLGKKSSPEPFLATDPSTMLSAGHHHPLLLLLLLLLAIPPLLRAQLDYPSANLSTIWTNDPSQLSHTANFTDGSQVRSILLRISPSFFGPTFACGFFCREPCVAFLFAVFAVYTNSGGGITLPTLASPQVVWSANRDRPVGANATLHFTAGGDLVLHDANGTTVWSTGTSGRSVVGMNITASGNLVLFDQDGKLVWQSFDHPTDSLLLGQTLKEGQRLVANTSMTNWTRGQVYLTVLSDGLYAFVDSTPPQLYYQKKISSNKATKNSTHIKYLNGSLVALSTESNNSDQMISLPSAPSLQFLRFESDGHLKIYEWRDEPSQGWQVTDNLLHLDDCAYPTVCGEYGICSNGQCSCPRGANVSSIYFQSVDDRKSSLGCFLVTPLSCQSMQQHSLLAADNVSYFNYIDSDAAALEGIDEERCKQACLKNCSCKAALFQYAANVSNGYCFLPSQLFSLQNNQPQISHYNSSAYIKVQMTNASPTPDNSGRNTTPGNKSYSVGVILGIVGALDYPSANLSTIWTNDPSQLPHTVSFKDGSQVRSILLRRSPNFFGPTFACGFYCKDACTTFLFAVFAVYTTAAVTLKEGQRLAANTSMTNLAPPQVVWSANRDRLVGTNATLHLTAGGDLILRGADGTAVWSAGTSGRRSSNLAPPVVWSANRDRLVGTNATLHLTAGGELIPAAPTARPSGPPARPAGWQVIADVLHLDVCAYPTVCGEYGICSNGQCSCPSGVNGSIYFRLIDDRKSNLGCSPVNPLSC
ncbi:hypothetical protein C4D60_Mb06t06690 [Musa balbisiana]|uniref:Bulb-type lectin domain-containing protein n=1 Tax=Musa balbisiana TaxID=52838 RepID=A0A4S8IL59_MUSBA|nr:hypothetical protein C4D60_Mb06t06690 [Musa balbisiana]